MLEVIIEFSKFVHKVVSPLGLLPSQAEFLKNLRFSGGNYSQFADILENDPGYETNLLNAANQMFESRLREPLITPEVALSMIGYIPSRNFLAASVIQGEIPGLLPNSPIISILLGFSLESEKLGGQFSTDYFMAGSVFDILCAKLFPVTTPPSKDKPKILNDLWKNGLLTAKIACQLSKALVPTLNLERDLCLDGLLHDVGKIGYYIVGSNQESDEKFLPEQRWTREVKEYGFSHDILGHLILWRLGFLNDTSWVILYHHQPFLAQKLGKTIQSRAYLIWLTDHIIRYQEFHRGPKYTDRILSNWFEIFKKVFGEIKKDLFTSTIKGIKLT